MLELKQLSLRYLRHVFLGIVLGSYKTKHTIEMKEKKKLLARHHGFCETFSGKKYA
jgi:hypothetical protein